MVIFYGPKETPEAQELGQEVTEEATSLLAAPYPQGASSRLVGPSGTPLT